MRSFSSPEDAAEALARGEVVAFPTETVYGLGADATNADAVAMVYRVKGRPVDHPLIVHGANSRILDRYGRHVPDGARRLADAFWPGPLTIIVNRRLEPAASSDVGSSVGSAAGSVDVADDNPGSNDPPVVDAVTGGRATVGLRVPDHPVALELLRQFERIGSGVVAAPSANRFGEVSPTTAQHVIDDLGGLDQAQTESVGVLDGGPCPVGVESTILDLTGPRPTMLRPGGISVVELSAVLGVEVVDGRSGEQRASGMLVAHYAPDAEVRLVAADELLVRLAENRTETAEESGVGGGGDGATRERPGRQGGRLGVIAPFVVDHQPSWALPADAAGYGRHIYGSLRAADRAGVDRLLVVAPTEGDMVDAVVDRLTKAAVGSARPAG